MEASNITCESTIIHEEVVTRVKSSIPDADNFIRLADLFKAFGDTTRVKILWALSCESMCVCDLAALLDMSVSAVSHQLKTLRLTNLVRYEKQGKVVYYSLAECHAKDIFQMGFEHIMEKGEKNDG